MKGLKNKPKLVIELVKQYGKSLLEAMKNAIQNLGDSLSQEVGKKSLIDYLVDKSQDYFLQDASDMQQFQLFLEEYVNEIIVKQTQLWWDHDASDVSEYHQTTINSFVDYNEKEESVVDSNDNNESILAGLSEGVDSILGE